MLVIWNRVGGGGSDGRGEAGGGGGGGSGGEGHRRSEGALTRDGNPGMERGCKTIDFAGQGSEKKIER